MPVVKKKKKKEHDRKKKTKRKKKFPPLLKQSKSYKIKINYKHSTASRIEMVQAHPCGKTHRCIFTYKCTHTCI